MALDLGGGDKELRHDVTGVISCLSSRLPCRFDLLSVVHTNLGTHLTGENIKKQCRLSIFKAGHKHTPRFHDKIAMQNVT